MSGSTPPADGHLLPATLYLRQHEVQVVAGAGGHLAAAWADDLEMRGMDGWTSGYSVSLDCGRSWSAPLFHRRADFAVTANPTIAADRSRGVFAVSMSVQDDYSSGILELASSIDSGGSWAAWRTIVSKEDGIPDRPRLLAAANGDLHLVFSNIERMRRSVKVLKSSIQHMRSMDHGQTWSEPHTISVGQQRSRWFIDGYQGPAMVEAPDGELLVSWADYYGNRVSLAVSRDAGVDFESPVRVRLKALPGTSVLTWMLGATFGTPVTEPAVDATGRNRVISVHEAHAMGAIVLVGSQDGGITWRRRARLTGCGTNASLQFDSTGRLHAIWTELGDQRVDIRYATSSDFGHTFAESISLAGNGASVALPRSTEGREEYKAALGSYQSLVIGADGTASAFWIDLREGLSSPRLYQSTWQV